MSTLFIPHNKIYFVSFQVNFTSERNKSKEATFDDIWTTSIFDKYVSRPLTPLFDDMNLTTFVCQYSIVSSPKSLNADVSDPYD